MSIHLYNCLQDYIQLYNLVLTQDKRSFKSPYFASRKSHVELNNSV